MKDIAIMKDNMKDKVDNVNSTNIIVKDNETTKDKVNDIFSTNYTINAKVKDKLYKHIH